MEDKSLKNIIESKGFSNAFRTMFKYSHSTGKESSIVSMANHKTGDFVFNISFGTFGSMEASYGPSGTENRKRYSINKNGKTISEIEALNIPREWDSSDPDPLNSAPVCCLDLHTHPKDKRDLYFSYEDISCYLNALSFSNKKINFMPLLGVVAAAERQPTALIYRPESITELDWLLSGYKEDKGMQYCFNKLREFGAAELINFNRDGTLSKKDSNIIKKLF